MQSWSRNTRIKFYGTHVTNQKSNYAVIVGLNLLWEFGINLDFQNNIVERKKIPMKSINCKMWTNFAIQESKNIKRAIERIEKILDAKYEKVNLKEITNKLKYSVTILNL